MTDTAEFEFTDELVELRDMVRHFCTQHVTEETVRKTMESDLGHDPALWRRLGSELGVLGLAVPEEYDGAGAGLVALAVAVEELGAALLCGPVLGSLALATTALCALDDETVKRDLLSRIVSGELVASVAAPFPRGAFDRAAVSVNATARDGGWVLDGRVEHVPDAFGADLLLVPAQGPEGLALYVVEGGSDGLSRLSLGTLDLTRRQAHVELASCPARRLAGAEATLTALEHAARTAAVLLAAEQVGGAQTMLSRTVAYVSERHQFGVPIGSFQAVKHRCADMLVAVEQARSVAYHGAWALERGTDDPELASGIAKAVASDAYLKVTKDAVQLHGGNGFTWEYAPHLYFKRATADLLTLGTPDDHLERLAAAVLDDAGSAGTA
jgi:alkylation response protein AidB-like acyl-CoA dehydrogenase